MQQQAVQMQQQEFHQTKRQMQQAASVVEAGSATPGSAALGVLRVVLLLRAGGIGISGGAGPSAVTALALAYASNSVEVLV